MCQLLPLTQTINWWSSANLWLSGATDSLASHVLASSIPAWVVSLAYVCSLDSFSSLRGSAASPSFSASPCGLPHHLCPAGTVFSGLVFLSPLAWSAWLCECLGFCLISTLEELFSSCLAHHKKQELSPYCICVCLPLLKEQHLMGKYFVV